MVKRVEVLHGEFPFEGRYGVLQERYARCDEHNIINIKQQVYHISTAAEDGQGGVGLGLNKSQSEEVCGEPVVPSPGHLIQPVERLVKTVDPIMLCGINKPRRLAASHPRSVTGAPPPLLGLSPSPPSPPPPPSGERHP
jgi:hypothetical protein